MTVVPGFFEMKSKGDCAYCGKWLKEEDRRKLMVSDMMGLIVCAAHYEDGLKSCADYTERRRAAIERMTPIQQEVVLALQCPFGFRRDGKIVEEGWYLSEKYDEKFFFKLEDGEWAVQIVKNAGASGPYPCVPYPCGVYFYPMRLRELLADGVRPASLTEEAVEALLVELDPTRIKAVAVAVAVAVAEPVAAPVSVDFWNDLRIKQYGALSCASFGWHRHAIHAAGHRKIRTIWRFTASDNKDTETSSI